MKQTKKFKEIILVHGKIQEMADKYHWNPGTIRTALRHPNNTELNMKIREVAVSEFNGIYLNR